MPGVSLKSLSVWEKRELASLLEEAERRRTRRLIHSMYPDSGPLRRELYARHMQFFRLGAHPGINERGFMAANRVGKTWGAGGYELTLHLTGDYPVWWEGRRFAHPVDAWAAGDTAETTRDIIQRCLLGPIDEFGTGLIPGDALVGEAKPSGAAPSIPAPRPPAAETMSRKPPAMKRGFLEWLFSLFIGGR